VLAAAAQMVHAKEPPAPPLDQFGWAKLLEVKHNLEEKGYEYYVYGGGDDIIGGFSPELFHVRAHRKIRCAIEGKYLYLVDEDGKVQRTTNFFQAEVTRRNLFWKVRHFWKLRHS
jgi:hypothetical protein